MISQESRCSESTQRRKRHATEVPDELVEVSKISFRVKLPAAVAEENFQMNPSANLIGTVAVVITSFLLFILLLLAYLLHIYRFDSPKRLTDF